MTFIANDPSSIAAVRNFVMGERKHCVSDREWAFRLRGYGYDLRHSEGRAVLHTLPHGVEVCALNV